MSACAEEKDLQLESLKLAEELPEVGADMMVESFCVVFFTNL